MSALKMSDTTFSRAESLRIRALTRSGMPRSPMISRTMWMPSVKTIPPRSSGMLCQSSAEHPTGVAAWNRARVIGTEDARVHDLPQLRHDRELCNMNPTVT